VISGDFDDSITPERCIENVILNARNGSIIVFHDSEKAFARMKICLPEVLKFFANKGFRFEKLES
jgi:hypothetical protein